MKYQNDFKTTTEKIETKIITSKNNNNDEWESF